MMKITERGILTLINSAVTGRSLSLPEGFDLEEAMPQIKRHNLQPLAYEGAVRCGVPQQPALQQLFISYCRAVQVSEGQMTEVRRIRGAFERENIDYMLLKGSVMKDFYPKPELRVMGDADILIREEQYPQIISVMNELGFQFVKESDHELVWKSPQLLLELHKRLIPGRVKEFSYYFGSGWQRSHLVQGNDYAMTDEDMFVFLFGHFAKHYRCAGIGCRHVTDLWVYLRTHIGMDDTLMERELKRAGLLKFYKNIRDLIGYWFEDGQASEKLELMSSYIFSSGSWGDPKLSRMMDYILESKHPRSGFWGKMEYIWQRVFPRFTKLSAQYPILRKAPWLYPAVWLYRLVQKVFDGKTVKKSLREADNLNQEDLERQQEILRYMGFE